MNPALEKTAAELDQLRRTVSEQAQRIESLAFEKADADDPSDGSRWPMTALPSTDKVRPRPGIPRSDGRLVAFTTRINRVASLYDFADPSHPVPKAAWTLSGNPDLAAFHKGRVIIPCGYQGLLLQR